MTILFSDDRNTYRDFRLPFLDRLKMLAEALPDDQRPLVDRAIIELIAVDEKKLHPMLMITHSASDVATAMLNGGTDVELPPAPKRAAPKPKKKTPKK